MVKLITLSDIKKLISTIGIENFFRDLIATLGKEYARWHAFEKSPRHAMHVEGGVIELMPIADDALYAFKYVNGHPNNPRDKKLTVVAIGMLSEIKHGYPLMISEMTVLTAMRTAATSALAAKYLAKKNTTLIGVIGTGAQAEFQVLAQKAIFPIETVNYFDVDQHAMEKFARNLKHSGLRLISCADAKSVIENVDIITTATAAKKHTTILQDAWIPEGLHINGIGGDCPGKTELDQKTLGRAKIVVEYLPQSLMEGELQQSQHVSVYAELWELAAGLKKGRESEREITLFDSVGFALEDFAILKFIYELSNQHHIGADIDLIPTLNDPKDLFGLIVNGDLSKNPACPVVT